MHRRTKLFIRCAACFVFIGIVAAGVLVWVGSTHPISQGVQKISVDTDPSTKEWRDRIKAVGATAAYQEFLAAYAMETPTEQHPRAHVFGRALYQTVGLDGVTVCDQHFNFGCFHEFLGLAIQERGLGIVPTLNEDCITKLKDNAPGCQHGLGHGIISYVGYDDKDLIKALEVCDKLRGQPPVGGCLGGEFMEYNLQTMLGDEAHIRPLHGDPYYPCDTLAEQFQDACYYEQPQWWLMLSWGDRGDQQKRGELFRRVGQWCAEAPRASLQRHCYLGIGNNAPPVVDWNEGKMVRECERMPTLDAEIDCRAAAAGAFFSKSTSQEAPWGTCNGLSAADYDRCVLIAQSPR